MYTRKMRSRGGAVDMSPLIKTSQGLRLHLALLASLSRTPLAGQVLEQTQACEGVRGHAGVDVWMYIYRTLHGAAWCTLRVMETAEPFPPSPASVLEPVLISVSTSFLPPADGGGAGAASPLPQSASLPGREHLGWGDVGEMRGVPGTPRAPLEESAEAALPV